MMESRFKDLKRIDLQEAEKYISADEDFKNNFIAFYTLTPSTDPNFPFEEDWDEVNYYTKRVRKPVPTSGEGKNTVYIMSNASFPHLLKIGSTNKEIEIRRQILSKATGVPTPFKLEYTYKIHGDSETMEREIHVYLKEFRNSNQREFFEIPLKQAIDAINFIGKNYV